MTPHVLCRIYGHDKQLLYIGITANPPARFTAHGKGKNWWSDVADIKLEHHDNRQALLSAERIAIKNERPRYNIVHNFAERRCETWQYLGGPNTTLPAWTDIATAPWFGQCAPCGRELGHNKPEVIVKLMPPGTRGDANAYGLIGDWYCLPCFERLQQDHTTSWFTDRRHGQTA